MSREKIFGTSVGTPLDRNQKCRVMAYARAWSARHRTGRQHTGPITRAAMDVLRALLWGFHNAATGKCFPGYEAIAAKAGCCRDTVCEAIKVLERAGVLRWVHRLRRVGERLLRTSNGYLFLAGGPRSENPPGTQIKQIQKESPPPRVIVLDPAKRLDRALIRLGTRMGALDSA